MRVVIRKLDNNNFILAEKFEEPVISVIAGKEIERNYKNIDKFYGTLYYALRGLFRHREANIPLFDKKLELVKPSSKEELYKDWLDKDTDEIIKKEEI